MKDGEQLRAGHIHVTFEALAEALHLPPDTHIVAVREIGARSGGEWPPRFIDVALVGGNLPVLSEGQSWPLIDTPVIEHK